MKWCVDLGAMQFILPPFRFKVMAIPGVAMSKASALDQALQRLQSSLDVLEAAVVRRKASDDVVAQLEEDVHLLAVDRSKLADTCDHLKAEAVHLSRANLAASQRLDQVVEVLQEVLAEEEAFSDALA